MIFGTLLHSSPECLLDIYFKKCRMIKFSRIVIVSFIFSFSIGCLSITSTEKEPTHFDIRKMRCYYVPRIGASYHDRDREGKYLVLDFTDSIYYFTPERASMYSTNSLYANTIADHEPTEMIEKIFLIAEDYTGFQQGDTINSVTNIDEILQNVNYQAQEKIYISFTQSTIGDGRDLWVHYFQTNGESYKFYVDYYAN